MPALEHFSIELNAQQQQGVYVAGQQVGGVVVVRLGESMKLRHLRLDIVGKAYTRWTVARTEHDHRSHQHHHHGSHHHHGAHHSTGSHIGHDHRAHTSSHTGASNCLPSYALANMNVTCRICTMYSA